MPIPPRFRLRRRWSVAALGLALALTAAASSARVTSSAKATRPAASLPVTYNFLVGVAAALANPSASPPGANNWSCQPSAAHPYPVVLVNGTGEDMADGFSALSPLLADNGYCVFAANFGGSPGNLLQGTGDITQSAAELASFVTQVLAATGASKVDLVGHSQGGMMPRYYLKFLGGAKYVNTLVALAPSNYGTTVDGLTTLASSLGAIGLVNSVINPLCPACVEQEQGSSFLMNLNSGGDTVPGVHYTVIESRDDEVVTPY